MVADKKMPLNSYTITHRDAILNEADRKLLVDFFNNLRTGESEKKEEHSTDNH